MIMKHAHKDHYGAQFHPESIGKPHGMQFVIKFLNDCKAHTDKN